MSQRVLVPGIPLPETTFLSQSLVVGTRVWFPIGTWHYVLGTGLLPTISPYENLGETIGEILGEKKLEKIENK